MSTDLPAPASPDTIHSALGAALASDGWLMVFDGATGQLKSANEDALFALEMSEDGLSDHSFESLVRSGDALPSEVWADITLGTKSKWTGSLVATLSMSEQSVTVTTAKLSEAPNDVVMHATKIEVVAATVEEPEGASAWRALAETVGVIQYNADGQVLWANDRAAMALEFYGESLDGKQHDSLWDQELAMSPEYVEFWNKLREGRIVEGTHKHVSGEGNPIWLQSTYVPIKGDSGMVEEVVQCLMDVTDTEVRAANDAKRSNALWSGVAIAEYDSDGHFVNASEAMFNLLETTHEALAGKEMSRFLNREFFKGHEFTSTWQDVCEGKICQTDIEHISETGRLVRTRSTLVPITGPAGGLQGIYEVATDVDKDLTELEALTSRYGAIRKDLAIAEFELGRKLITCNSVYRTLLNLEEEDLPTFHHKDSVAEDFQRNPRYQAFWDKLADGDTVKGQFPRLRKDGRQLWFDAVYLPVRNRRTGQVDRVFFFAKDITQIKSIQNENQTKMDAVQRSMAVVEFDTESKIIHANERFAETMGYPIEELTNMKHALLCSKNYAESDAYRSFWERLRQGEAVSGEVLRMANGGREVWLQASYNPLRDKDGNFTRILKFAFDITDKKEKFIDVSRKWKATEQSHAICEFSPEGNVEFANDVCLRLFGYTLREMVGQHHSMFCTPDAVQSEEYRDFWLRLGKGEEQSGLFNYVGRFDRDVTVDAHFVPVSDDQGHVVRVIMFAYDATELQALKKEISSQANGVIQDINVVLEENSLIATEAKSLTDALSGYSQSMSDGKHMLSSSLEDISGLTSAIERISEIVDMLGEIAVQTNLLAFNAAIEAARAGEHGVGFSIVADEVRKLAERNAEAARDISRHLDQVNDGVTRGTNGAQKTASLVSETVDHLKSSDQTVSELISKCQTQAEAIHNINSVVRQLNGGIVH